MKIPEQFINKNQLKNLPIGAIGYAVPWVMWVDMEGNAFLNENYDLHPSKGGTVNLQITKVPEGYVVHLDKFRYYDREYTWTKQESPGFASPNEVCYGRVVAFSDKEYQALQKDPERIRNLINECILNENYEQAREYQNILDQLN